VFVTVYVPCGRYSIDSRLSRCGPDGHLRPGGSRPQGM